MSVCAVITGAAGALGSAVARELAKRPGVKLALVDSPRHEARAQSLAQEVGGAAFAADLADKATWPALTTRIENALGPIALAAFVAGGYQGGAPFWETDEDAWNAMMTGNLDTAARGMRALLPGMVSRRDGKIVVIGSRAVERPWTSKGAAAYATSKAALVALARVVAAEALPFGVTINAVLPSTLDTPANRASMPDADFSSWVSLDSAASAIAFLLSDGARDISGTTIPLYGRA